jgi:hypothetical protein
VATLLLAAAISALTLVAGRRAPDREPTPRASTQPRPEPSPARRQRARSPVSATDLRLVHRVAQRFLLKYLRFAYGKERASSAMQVTPALRRELTRQRAQVTPAERGRHPRVLSLHLVGTEPGFVLATARIEGGGIATYPLRFALQELAGRWLVSDIQEG